MKTDRRAQNSTHPSPAHLDQDTASPLEVSPFLSAISTARRLHQAQDSALLEDASLASTTSRTCNEVEPSIRGPAPSKTKNSIL